MSFGRAKNLFNPLMMICRKRSTEYSKGYEKRLIRTSKKLWIPLRRVK